MRHKPRLIDRVAVKAAPHVIVDATLRHLAQRVPGHIDRRAPQLRLQTLLRRTAKQKRQIARTRKFRRTTTPAVFTVERLVEILEASFKRRARRLRQITTVLIARARFLFAQ